ETAPESPSSGSRDAQRGKENPKYASPWGGGESRVSPPAAPRTRSPAASEAAARLTIRAAAATAPRTFESGDFIAFIMRPSRGRQHDRARRFAPQVALSQG